jgi:uncharacterized protein (DUF4415 family)
MTKHKSINYLDIPETDEAFWKNAKVHFPRRKQMVTIRLDPEIVEWFQENGRGYQTKINAVLKSYIEAHPHHR